MGKCTKPNFVAIYRSTSRAETAMTEKEDLCKKVSSVIKNNSLGNIREQILKLIDLFVEKYGFFTGLLR